MVQFSSNFKTVMMMILEDDMEKFNLNDIINFLRSNTDAFPDMFLNLQNYIIKKNCFMDNTIISNFKKINDKCSKRNEEEFILIKKVIEMIISKENIEFIKVNEVKNGTN